MIYVMCRYAERVAIRCEAIASGLANAAAILDFMVINAIVAFHCLVVSMAIVMFLLNATVIKVGMVYSVKIVSIIFFFINLTFKTKRRDSRWVLCERFQHFVEKVVIRHVDIVIHPMNAFAVSAGQDHCAVIAKYYQDASMGLVRSLW